MLIIFLVIIKKNYLKIYQDDLKFYPKHYLHSSCKDYYFYKKTFIFYGLNLPCSSVKNLQLI